MFFFLVVWVMYVAVLMSTVHVLALLVCVCMCPIIISFYFNTLIDPTLYYCAHCTAFI